MQQFISRLMLPISASMLAYRYYNHANFETSYDNIEADTEWLLARIPNLNECFTASWPLAIINMAAEKSMATLYNNNPIAKAVVRDLTKIPSNVASWWYGNEVGHTNIKYDEGNIYGGIAKALCKSSIIGMHAMIHQELEAGSLEATSRISNYFCEPITRVFALVSKQKQLSNSTEVNYVEYAIQNTDSELLIQAAIEGVTKNTIADQVGSFFGALGIFSFLKNFYIGTENKFILNTAGAVGGNFLIDRIHAVHGATPNQYLKKGIVITSLLATDLALKTATEMITTFLVAPATRITQDLSGTLVNEYWEEYVGISHQATKDGKNQEVKVAEIEQFAELVDNTHSLDYANLTEYA